MEKFAVNRETLVYITKSFFLNSEIFLHSSVPSKIWASVKSAKRVSKVANFSKAFV